MTKEAQIRMVSRDGRNISSIENPDKDVQLAAVQKNVEAIIYIKNPDKDVQLAAVQKDVYAIGLIKNPDKDVQLAAVQQNAYVIRHIENPDKDVQLAAVQQSAYAIGLIKNPDKDVQLAAVQKDAYAIGRIENPDKDVQLAAVQKDALAIKSIDDPSDDVRKAAEYSVYKDLKNNGIIYADGHTNVFVADKYDEFPYQRIEEGLRFLGINAPDDRIYIVDKNRYDKHLRIASNKDFSSPDVEAEYLSVDGACKWLEDKITKRNPDGMDIDMINNLTKMKEQISAYSRGIAIDKDKPAYDTPAVGKGDNMADINAVTMFKDSNKDMSGKVLRNIDFSGMDLSGVTFKNADLRNAKFIGANVEGANFSGADLRKSDFENAIATGANFSRTSLKDASFSGANLDNALFLKAEGNWVEMYGASARGAEFNGAVMTDMRIFNSDVSFSKFDGANLSGAVIQNTAAGGTSFRDADLTDMRFEGIKLDGHPINFDGCKNYNPLYGQDSMQEVFETEDTKTFITEKGFPLLTFDSPEDPQKKAVISLSADEKNIAISLPDSWQRKSAEDIAASLWGQDANGNKRFAVSPKGWQMGTDDLTKAAMAVEESSHSITMDRREELKDIRSQLTEAVREEVRERGLSGLSVSQHENSRTKAGRDDL